MRSTLIRVYLRGRKRSAPRGRLRPPPGAPGPPIVGRWRRAIRLALACGSVLSSPSQARRLRGGRREGGDHSQAVAWLTPGGGLGRPLERDVVVLGADAGRLRLEVRGVG